MPACIAITTAQTTQHHHDKGNEGSPQRLRQRNDSEDLQLSNVANNCRKTGQPTAMRPKLLQRQIHQLVHNAPGPHVAQWVMS
eukprot:10266311-Karenia_brevis.AAC.1